MFTTTGVRAVASAPTALVAFVCFAIVNYVGNTSSAGTSYSDGVSFAYTHANGRAFCDSANVLYNGMSFANVIHYGFANGTYASNGAGVRP